MSSSSYGVLETRRINLSFCHNASSENKCQQFPTLLFVSNLFFLIGYLSVEISRLPTVSIYSGRLPVFMKYGLQVSALKTSRRIKIYSGYFEVLIIIIKKSYSVGRMGRHQYSFNSCILYTWVLL